jgi:hypothetical protein
MTKEEFLENYALLVQMPESENPTLYRRVRQWVQRLHKLHDENKRSKIPATGWNEYLPPPRETCPDCTPEEVCQAHELLELVTEFQKFNHR